MAGTLAGATSTALEIASTIVKVVHDLTRDVISQIAGTAISAAITTAATLGFGAPVAIAQVAARVSALAPKVIHAIEALTKALQKLIPLLKHVDEINAAIKRVLDRVLHGGGSVKPTAVAPPVRLPASTYRRPSGFRVGVRDQVLDDARIAGDGSIIDPVTQMKINPDEPWHMGHKPGLEFRKSQVWAAENGLTRTEFLDHYNTPEHYRPELPLSNSGHKGEDSSDVYLGGIGGE